MAGNRNAEGVLIDAAGLEALKRPHRDRPFDDILMVWGRKVREVRECNYREPDQSAASRHMGVTSWS